MMRDNEIIPHSRCYAGRHGPFELGGLATRSLPTKCCMEAHLGKQCKYGARGYVKIKQGFTTHCREPGLIKSFSFVIARKIE